MTKPSMPFSKRVKPQIFDQNQLVHRRVQAEGANLPLVLQPAVNDLDAVGWLANHREEIQTDLVEHGAILFRGFNVDTPHHFETFAETICPHLYTEYGDLPKKEGKFYGVTPYPPDKTIYFHNESSHMPFWPLKQFFYCDVPARSGGATPIVDCREIYAALAPDIRMMFETKGLKYKRNFIAGVDVSWQDFFKTEDPEEVGRYCVKNGIQYRWDPDGNLRTHQICPAVYRHPQSNLPVFFNQLQLHHPAFLDKEVRVSLSKFLPDNTLPRDVSFADDQPIGDELALRIEELYWQKSVSFDWRHGDVLLVDNVLTAHARMPYEEPRKMYVAMGEIHYRAENHHK